MKNLMNHPIMLIFKFIVKKHIQFFLDRNVLLSLALLFWNTWNLMVNSKNNYSVPISVVMLIIYLSLYRGERSFKIRFVLVYVMFSLLTITAESAVVYGIKGDPLNYQSTSFGTNVPIWLFSTYLNLMVLLHLLNQYVFFVQNEIYLHIRDDLHTNINFLRINPT